jgi:hypothetical protein
MFFIVSFTNTNMNNQENCFIRSILVMK